MRKQLYAKRKIGEEIKCDFCEKELPEASHIAKHFEDGELGQDVCHECIKLFPQPILIDEDLCKTELVEMILNCMSNSEETINLNTGVFSLWGNEYGNRFFRKHDNMTDLENYISGDEADHDEDLLEVLRDGKPLRAIRKTILTYSNENMGW